MGRRMIPKIPLGRTHRLRPPPGSSISLRWWKMKISREEKQFPFLVCSRTTVKKSVTAAIKQRLDTFSWSPSSLRLARWSNALEGKFRGTQKFSTGFAVRRRSFRVFSQRPDSTNFFWWPGRNFGETLARREFHVANRESGHAPPFHDAERDGREKSGGGSGRVDEESFL